MAQTRTKTKAKKTNKKIVGKLQTSRWKVPLFVLGFALIGAYAVYIARAQSSICAQVTGGLICNVNQVAKGSDTLVDSGGGEAADKLAEGWTDLGTPFKVPNFAQNGAKPVHRFVNTKTSSHALAIEGSDYYDQFKHNGSFLNGFTDEGIMFWAWPTSAQAGTVPVYAFSDGNGAGFNVPTSYNVYSTSTTGGSLIKSTKKISQDGIVFYAYPVSYSPPASAQPANTNTTKASQQKVNVAPPPINANTAQVTAKQAVAAQAGQSAAPVRDVDAENIQQFSINSERSKAGLPTIYRSRCLDQSATEKTLDMIKKNVLEHSPNISTPVDKACGKGWTGMMENLGVGGTSPGVFTALMNSEGHRKNILNNFQKGPNSKLKNGVGMMGISAYRDASGGLWVTQHFVQCETSCSSNFTNSSY